MTIAGRLQRTTGYCQCEVEVGSALMTPPKTEPEQLDLPRRGRPQGRPAVLHAPDATHETYAGPGSYGLAKLLRPTSSTNHRLKIRIR